MKWIFFVVLTTSALVGKPQPQPQSVAETVQQVMQLRQQVTDFYANPDPDAVQAIRDRWQEIPAEIRNRIESRHPGTNARILLLDSEIAPPVTKPETVTLDTPIVPSAATVPPPATNTIANPDIWQSSSPTAGKDQWAIAAPAPKPREVNTAPLLYSDDLDIFGNRPKPRIKR